MYGIKFDKKTITELFSITFGAFLMGTALAVFLVPLKIAAGGVGGLATVIHYVSNIRTSILILAINIPIFLIGLICFDFRFLVRSFYGMFVLSVATDVMSLIYMPIDDALLACVFGGAIMGLGISFVIRSGGTTGGTDILVLVIRKFKPDLSVGQLFLMLDGIIVAIAGIVFSSWETILYSVATILISSYVTDVAIEGLKFARLVYIISDKNIEITSRIYTEMNRGVTGITSVSMYTGRSGRVLMCAIRKYELTTLKKLIYSVDKNAFVIISDAKEVMGNGFESNEI